MKPGSLLRSMGAAALLAVAATAANAASLARDSVYQLAAPLVDQSGRAFTWADQRGRARVVVMFYTSCKFICPTIIDTVLDLERQLAPAERVRLGVLMISLDPQRDDAKALAATARQRQLDLERWTLAQPRAADVRAIAGVLGVRYRPLDDGEINHTGVLVLLDAEGRIVARSAKTSGAVEAAFLKRVRELLAKP
jgi:protein SCO1